MSLIMFVARSGSVLIPVALTLVQTLRCFGKLCIGAHDIQKLLAIQGLVPAAVDYLFDSEVRSTRARARSDGGADFRSLAASSCSAGIIYSLANELKSSGGDYGDYGSGHPRASC